MSSKATLMITPIRQEKSSILRSAITAFLLVHLFAVVVLASLPRLHEHIHADAGAGGHECAITLFQQGGYSGVSAGIAIAAIVTWVALSFFPPRQVWVENAFLSGNILEHAPPRS